MPELEVLYEDNHLLVINKPAGLATMGTMGLPTAHEICCRYIQKKYNKPGRVFLGVVHRLDAMSSGVLMFARTSKSASRLSDQFRQSDSELAKIYLAVVSGVVSESGGTWHDWLAKNESARRMESVSPSTSGAVTAELRYRVLDKHKTANIPYTLVAVRLITGRKHQIRVQFAARGHAVYGDVKYGAAKQSMLGIALHARSLTIRHPTLKTVMLFHAGIPPAWSKWQLSAGHLESAEQMNSW